VTPVIEALSQPPMAARRVEVVERKGLGHPDTICDALVEAVAVALNRMYRERAGAILHYNIDKALLVAGQCVTGFGWGELTRPMTLYVGDRATFEADGVKLPVEETMGEAVDEATAPTASSPSRGPRGVRRPPGRTRCHTRGRSTAC